jgi:hypothetical protein
MHDGSVLFACVSQHHTNDFQSERMKGWSKNLEAGELSPNLVFLTKSGGGFSEDGQSQCCVPGGRSPSPLLCAVPLCRRLHSAWP